MKKVLVLLIILVNVFSLSCCKENEIIESKIRVYNVKTNGDTNEREVLLFSLEDISSYIWAEHRIIFKSEFDYNSGDIGTDNPQLGSQIFGTDSRDIFRLYIDDTLIYEGEYNQAISSSYVPEGIVMFDLEDGVKFELGITGIDSNYDKRNDERLYRVLEDAGLLED